MELAVEILGTFEVLVGGWPNNYTRPVCPECGEVLLKCQSGVKVKRPDGVIFDRMTHWYQCDRNPGCPLKGKRLRPQPTIQLAVE